MEEYNYFIEFDDGVVIQCHTETILRQMAERKIPSFYALMFHYKTIFPHTQLGKKSLEEVYTYSRMRSWWVESDNGEIYQHSSEVI